MTCVCHERNGDRASDGRIELIVGPMFAFKSSELQRRARRHALAGRRVVILKHERDTRYDAQFGGDAAATHDGLSSPALRVRALADVDADAWDVLCIDECHFYDALVEHVLAWARAGKTVIAAGLCADFAGCACGGIADVLAHADSVLKLAAVCARCGRDAVYTRRITPVPADGDLVGGARDYEPNCRRCWATAADPK